MFEVYPRLSLQKKSGLIWVDRHDGDRIKSLSCNQDIKPTEAIYSSLENQEQLHVNIVTALFTEHILNLVSLPSTRFV